MVVALVAVRLLVASSLKVDYAVGGSGGGAVAAGFNIGPEPGGGWHSANGKNCPIPRGNVKIFDNIAQISSFHREYGCFIKQEAAVSVVSEVSGSAPLVPWPHHSQGREAANVLNKHPKDYTRGQVYMRSPNGCKDCMIRTCTCSVMAFGGERCFHHCRSFCSVFFEVDKLASVHQSWL